MRFDLPGARANHPGQGVAGIELPSQHADVLPVVIAVHGGKHGADDFRYLETTPQITPTHYRKLLER